MVRGKIARRLIFLFLVVALLPLILLGIRFEIDVDLLIIYAFYAVFITMIVAHFLLRGIVGQIKRLTEGAMRLAGGDLDYRVPILYLLKTDSVSLPAPLMIWPHPLRKNRRH